MIDALNAAGRGDRLGEIFAALADGTRRAILARLTEGEASVGELAEPFALSQPAISKHLRILERAGLVSRGRKAQRRPCRLEVAPLVEAAVWMENYRRIWRRNFDRLDNVLEDLQSDETPSEQKHREKKRAKKTRKKRS